MGITTRRRAIAGRLPLAGTVLAGVLASVLSGAPAAAAVPDAATGPVEPAHHCQRFTWENPDQGTVRASDCRTRPPASVADPIYVPAIGHWRPIPPSAAR